AWSVLAQCYDDMGERGKALQFSIIAVHLNKNADERGEFTDQLCALRLYPTNVNALWDRASLARKIGDLNTVTHSTTVVMLKRLPHHVPVRDELRPNLTELSDFVLCAELFQRAFDHY
ncbi:hypothetical protein BV20DRAFT_930263, partial [Pilatotrama ljubarskyi]